MLIMGLDIGTTSICCVLYDGEQKKIIKTVSGPNEFIKNQKENFAEQDAEKIWGIASQLTDEAGGIKGCAAIGITGQMHGILYVNDAGEPVSPLITWKDKRADLIYRQGLSYAEYLTEATGYPVYSGYGIASHFYNYVNKRVPTGAARLCTIADYVAMKFAGAKMPRMESSMAASVGAYDLAEGVFDKKAILKVGILPECLPEVVPSGTVLGMNGECRVICACGDNQASFLGAVSEPENEMLINVGTGSQVCAFHKHLIHTEASDVRPYFDRGWLYTCASLNGGKVYEHLAMFMEDICRCFAGVEVNAYDTMKQLLKEKKETTLQIRPCLYGERDNVLETGSVTKLTDGNFTAADVIYGYVKGMAAELKALSELLPAEAAAGKTKLCGSGNGLRRNEALASELKRIFKTSLRFGDWEEEAAAGAALWADVQMTGKEDVPYGFNQSGR